MLRYLIQKKLFIISAVILFIILIISEGRANDPLCSQINCSNNMLKNIPQALSGSGDSYSFGGKTVTFFKYNVHINKKSNELIFLFKSGISEIKSNLDASLRLKKSILKINPKMEKIIKLSGYDKRISVWDIDNKIIKIDYYLNDKIIKNKEITYNAYLIDADHLTIYLQALLINNLHKSFENDLVAGIRGFRLKVALTLFKTKKPLINNDQYKIPKELVNAIEPANEYYVYEMRTIGFIGLFYKTKYYFVYETKYPYKFIAYYGGPKGYEQCIFINSGKK